MVSLSLDWASAMAFRNSEGSPAITLHSSTPGVTSPPQALAYAVMGCMGMDVVHVLEKGRHRIDALRIRFDGVRAGTPPRRFTHMGLTFEVTTSAPAAVVDRAIALSREKYCSVWHTIRPDVELVTNFVVHPVGDAPIPRA